MSQLALIALSAAVLYFFWKFCRAVVKWGFFTAYFCSGAVAAWLFAPQAPPWTPLVAGLLFAWAVVAIKSKIFKALSAAAVLGASALVLPALYPASAPESEGSGLVRSQKERASSGGNPGRPKASGLKAR